MRPAGGLAAGRIYSAHWRALLELTREDGSVSGYWFPLCWRRGARDCLRNKPAGRLSVAIVAGPGAQKAEALLRALPAASTSFKIGGRMA